MQTGKDRYTSRSEVEKLLQETREGAESKQGKQKTKKTAKSTMRIVRRVIYALLIIALLSMLGKVWYQKLNGEPPSLFGYQLYVVETGSMVPTLPIGTNILVRQLAEGEMPKVGDIVTYTHEGKAITHRIIETVVGEDGVTRYQTKGDNPENSNDPWLVALGDIRGVVVWHFSLTNYLGNR